MKTTKAVAALAALAQDRRLGVFRLLVQQGTSGMAAGEIAERLRISPASLSFHLKELTHAALVKSRQDGRYIYYSANYAEMDQLLGFLTENCCVADGVTCNAAAECGSSSVPTSKRKVKA